MFSINPAAEEKAELQFSHTGIVAAADGVIAKKTVEITSRPRKMNTSSTPVCTIVCRGSNRRPCCENPQAYHLPLGKPSSVRYRISNIEVSRAQHESKPGVRLRQVLIQSQRSQCGSLGQLMKLPFEYDFVRGATGKHYLKRLRL